MLSVQKYISTPASFDLPLRLLLFLYTCYPPNISLHPPLALCPVTSCPRCEGDGYIRHVIKREMCRGEVWGGRGGRKQNDVPGCPRLCGGHAVTPASSGALQPQDSSSLQWPVSGVTQSTGSFRPPTPGPQLIWHGDVRWRRLYLHSKAAAALAATH